MQDIDREPSGSLQDRQAGRLVVYADQGQGRIKGYGRKRVGGKPDRSILCGPGRHHRDSGCETSKGVPKRAGILAGAFV
jgi:hypothetical protein